jgi:hypothetical protein
MTTIDNSKIFLGGIFTDADVTVAANETLVAGTILGRNSDDELVAFTTANEGSQPIYILAQDIANTGDSDITTMCRVYECGEVDASKLTFAKAADATDVAVLDALKTNGYTLVNVQQLAE